MVYLRNRNIIRTWFEITTFVKVCIIAFSVFAVFYLYGGDFLGDPRHLLRIVLYPIGIIIGIWGFIICFPKDKSKEGSDLGINIRSFNYFILTYLLWGIIVSIAGILCKERYVAYVVVLLEISTLSFPIRRFLKWFFLSTGIYLLALFFLTGDMNIIDRIERLFYAIVQVTIIYGFILTKYYSERRQNVISSQLKKQLYTDFLTGVKSRVSYNDMVSQIGKNYKENLAVLFIDANGLKDINDERGHEAGDELLCGVAEAIQNAVGEYGDVYRTGGDEFQAIIYTKHGKERIRSMIRKELESYQCKYIHELSAAIGIAMWSDAPNLSISELFKLAEMEMYKDKTWYYMVHNIDRRRSSNQ